MQCSKVSLLPGIRRLFGKGIMDSGRLRPISSLSNYLLLVRGMAGKNDCKKEEDEVDRKGISCRRPDLRQKPIQPYKYGFCREADPLMKMSCPPKGIKRAKGPCCHDEGPQKKGGCKVNK